MLVGLGFQINIAWEGNMCAWIRSPTKQFYAWSAYSTHFVCSIKKLLERQQCKFVKKNWSMLVVKGIFKQITYLMYSSWCMYQTYLVGHAHDNMDASFGRWSMDRCEKWHPTNPLLMKSCVVKEKVATIPHDQRAYGVMSLCEVFLPSGNNILFIPQQFKLFVQDDRWM